MHVSSQVSFWKPSYSEEAFLVAQLRVMGSQCADAQPPLPDFPAACDPTRLVKDCQATASHFRRPTGLPSFENEHESTPVIFSFYLHLLVFKFRRADGTFVTYLYPSDSHNPF